MVQFVYTGGRRKDAPKYIKAFDEWFELNGNAMTITSQFYIAKLRGNSSFLELDDSLLIKEAELKTKATTKTKAVVEAEVIETVEPTLEVEVAN